MILCQSKKLIEQLMSELASIHNLSSRSLFGGFSLNYNDIMFGYVYDNSFYLRGHPDYISFFDELDMEPLLFNASVGPRLLRYYKVTDSLRENNEQFITTNKMVIDYAIKDKEQKRKLKESRIKDLPNITPSLERLLINIGIANVDVFRQVGACEVFYRLQQNNANISINILYTLHASLQGLHVVTLSVADRKQLELCYQQVIAKHLQEKHSK